MDFLPEWGGKLSLGSERRRLSCHPTAHHAVYDLELWYARYIKRAAARAGSGGMIALVPTSLSVRYLNITPGSRLQPLPSAQRELVA